MIQPLINIENEKKKEKEKEKEKENIILKQELTANLIDKEK